MANTVLQTYMDANPGKGPVEAAVEVILDNLSAGAAGGLTNAQLRAADVPVALTAAITAAIGTKSDAAWSGSGDGTLISVLKKIALNTTA
jgi:hypothetical protein